VTRWARLTWQAVDPDQLALDLGRRLDVTPSRRSGPPATFAIRLGDTDLDLVPWRHEGPDDRPQPGGRLVLEPIPGGEPKGERPTPATSGSDPGRDDPLVLAGIAWATVELDRAAAELAAWLTPERTLVPDRPPGFDPHLGARTRALGSRGLPGEVMVLVEPATEGLVAGSLARHGEGPCALYLRATAGLDAWITAARARRLTVSPRRDGPLGRSVLVPGREAGRDAVAAPQIIVVDGRPEASEAGVGGTISP
jgi:hypothetical protein